MAEVECFVCKAQGKRDFTFEVDDKDVDSIVNCPFCKLQLVLRKRGGKLKLDYPDIAEEETVEATNFDNMKDTLGANL